MTQAPPEEQMRLLQLQHLDAQLTAIGKDIAALDEDPEAAALYDEYREAKQAHARIVSERDAAASALAALERELERINERIAKDEVHLNAGGLSKELLALQSDIESLIRSRASTEDEVLAAMEALEAVEQRCRESSLRLESSQERYERRHRELQERKSAQRELQEQIRSDRAALAATFDPSLLELYERTRARRGIGAARLFHKRSEGSGMQLSPADVEAITRTPLETIVFCPDSGCILVRSPDWS